MKWWVLGGVSVAVLVAAFFALEMSAKRKEAEWAAFVAKWEARGEAFDVAGNLPPARPEAEELFAHPWIRKIMAGDPDLWARLGEMGTGEIEGWDAWLDSADEEGILPPMPEGLAGRVERHYARFQAEVDQLTEALQRPGSRFPVGATPYVLGADSRIAQLSAVSKLLDAVANAAISRDDPEEFTRLIELQLRTAEKLRSSNLMMTSVAGAGFEGSAFEALKKAESARKWPHAEKKKWLAALGLRKRSVADETAAALRVNRGIFLEMVRGFEKSASAPPSIFFAWVKPVRRKFYAETKLAACQEFQETVLADGEKLAATINPEKLQQFDTKPIDKNAGPAGAMAQLLTFPSRGIFNGLQTLEVDREALRKKLSDELAGKPD